MRNGLVASFFVLVCWLGAYQQRHQLLSTSLKM